jgi:peroxiredoxin family protein
MFLGTPVIVISVRTDTNGGRFRLSVLEKVLKLQLVDLLDAVLMKCKACWVHIQVCQKISTLMSYSC